MTFRMRERAVRWIFVVWLILAIILYGDFANGRHTSTRQAEFFILLGLSVVLAMVLAGLARVDQPQRGIAWRILTIPILWAKWLWFRKRRKRAGRTPIYARNSDLYHQSYEARDLPPFVRRAQGLPEYHEESQWH